MLGHNGSCELCLRYGTEMVLRDPVRRSSSTGESTVLQERSENGDSHTELCEAALAHRVMIFLVSFLLMWRFKLNRFEGSALFH